MLRILAFRVFYKGSQNPTNLGIPHPAVRVGSAFFISFSICFFRFCSPSGCGALQSGPGFAVGPACFDSPLGAMHPTAGLGSAILYVFPIVFYKVGSLGRWVSGAGWLVGAVGLGWVRGLCWDPGLGVVDFLPCSWRLFVLNWRCLAMLPVAFLSQ